MKLEEKVPSIKTETDDVLEALGERKDAVYTTLTAGKEAITSRLANGKGAISTTIQNGKDAVYNRIQSGSEVLANSRAGCLVGQGVDKTLQLTETAVEYLLPRVEEDEGGPQEREGTEMKSMVRVEGEESESESSEEEEMEAEGEKEEEEEEQEEGGEKGDGVSRTGRVKNLSRKVKLRVYYRTLHRLDSVQQQCKSALEQLKMHIDLVSWCSVVQLSSCVWLWLCGTVALLSLCDLYCLFIDLVTKEGSAAVLGRGSPVMSLLMRQG